MNLLPALTIGLSFGLVAGLVVYYVIDYFEADEKIDQNTPETVSAAKPIKHITNKRTFTIDLQNVDLEDNLQETKTTVKPTNCVEVVFNGRAEMIELPPLKEDKVVTK